MKRKEAIIERCPKCQASHERGEFLHWQEGDKVIAAPADVPCQCGLLLKWAVPIFCVTPSGYVLVPKPDAEPRRIEGKHLREVK